MNDYVGIFHLPGRKQTCEQCKSRKVRCCGNTGAQGCATCSRLGFHCSFCSPSGGSVPNSSNNTRQRGSKACELCRRQRTRCVGGPGQCTNCGRRGVQCEFSVSKRRRDTPSKSQAVNTDQRDENGGSRGIREPIPKPIAGRPESLACMTTSLQNGSAQAISTLSLENSGTPHMVVSFETELAMPCSAFSPLRTWSAYSPGSSFLTMETSEYFLANVYPVPSYSFFHPESLRKSQEDGTLEQSLILAIRATVSLHRKTSAASQAEHYSTENIEEAEQLIWRDIDRTSVSRLQALLLIMRHRMETGCFQRAFMIAAIAARVVTALQFNFERVPAVPIASELRRRVVWSFKLLESYFSIGFSEHELCPFETIYLQFPSSEEDFESQLIEPVRQSAAFVADTVPTIGNQRTESAESGAFSCCVRLLLIRRDIMKLTRGVAIRKEPFPELQDLLAAQEKDLDTISSRIPRSLNVPNISTIKIDISKAKESRWLARYMMMYLSWHQCNCDFYRFLLPGFPEAAPKAILEGLHQSIIDNAAARCLEHACAIIEALTKVHLQSQKSVVLEYDSAVCGYHAVRILLFLSQSNRNHSSPFSAHLTAAIPSPEYALSHAQLCLASLDQFFHNSPMVQPLVQDIERLIKAFAASPSSERDGVSQIYGRRDGKSVTTEQARGQPSELSWAATTRQQLALHSLLRRANFCEGE